MTPLEGSVKSAHHRTCQSENSSPYLPKSPFTWLEMDGSILSTTLNSTSFLSVFPSLHSLMMVNVLEISQN